MTDIRLTYRPGIDLESTETTSRGSWSFSNNIRWRENQPEKMRGWMRDCPTPVPGVGRTIHSWTDLSAINRVAVGTHIGLQLLVYELPPADNMLVDITPVGFAPGERSSGGTPFSIRIWDLDNFGQNLIATPSGNGIYVWVPPALTPATLITQAPPHNQGAFVSMPQRILVAYGSSPDFGVIDPLLVRWCDQNDYTSWTPLTTNAAGSFRLSRGSRIVGGLQTPLGAFLWTDLDLWTMQFEGQPLIFGFFQLGSNCGLIGQKAVTVAGSVPYWLSDHGFFRTGSGGVEQIPCPVWDDVFLDLDIMNSDKCIAGTDYHYSEVWFMYPSLSGNTGEIDSWVKFNFVENLWDAGKRSQMSRTAWTDQNRPGPPLTIDLNGLIQQQDVGHDADGSALLSSIRSGFNDLQDGGAMVYIERYIPDFKFEGTKQELILTFFVRDYPTGDIKQTKPIVITSDTEYVMIELRGREWSEQIETKALDTWYRRGTPRARIAPDGSL